MLTDKEMEAIAKKYIDTEAEETNLDLVLFLKHTIKKPYGNVYRYNSKKFIEEKDYDYALIGNGPFLVENSMGKIVQFGTGKTLEYFLTEYEEGRWPNNRK